MVELNPIDSFTKKVRLRAVAVALRKSRGHGFESRRMLGFLSISVASLGGASNTDFLDA